jgi:hypothetical protein
MFDLKLMAGRQMPRLKYATQSSDQVARSIRFAGMFLPMIAQRPLPTVLAAQGPPFIRGVTLG